MRISEINVAEERSKARFLGNLAARCSGHICHDPSGVSDVF